MPERRRTPLPLTVGAGQDPQGTRFHDVTQGPDSTSPGLHPSTGTFLVLTVMLGANGPTEKTAVQGEPSSFKG